MVKELGSSDPETTLAEDDGIPSSYQKSELKPAKTTNFFDFEVESALDCLTNGIRIIDSSHTIQYVNQAFCSLSGLQREFVLGKKCREVFPGSLCDTGKCSLERIRNGEKAIVLDIDRTRKNGSTIPCTLSVFPLYSKRGRFIGIMESFRDNSRRRGLQEKLEESEDRYRALVELSAEVGESILMAQDLNGKEGVITFTSEQFTRLTGFSKGELLGKAGFSFIAPEDRRGALSRHRRKIKGEILPGLYEVSVIRKDGSRVPVELTSALTHYRGEPANVIYLRDITQRKKLETALAEEKDKFQSLFEEAPAAIWEMDYSHIKNHIDRLFSRGITDLKSYFESNPREAFSCLRLSRIIGVNRAAVSLWEADSKTHLCRGITDLVAARPTGQSRELENIIAFSRGETQLEYEIADPTFKGRWKHLYVRYHITPGCGNTWSRVLASFTDITPRKQAEERLKAYQGQLEETVNQRTLQLRMAEDRLKQLLQTERQLRRDIQEKMAERIEFTRALVHELKTPLTPMMACSEALLSVVEGEPQASLVRNVNIGASRLSRKVDDLIDLARGEVGILHLRCRQVDPVKILREVADYIELNASQKNLEIVIDYSNELPKIKADRERLIQVLLNLLDNAVKYTPSPGRITIKAWAEDNWLNIQVSDTGMGISQEQMKHLFQPYKRFSSTRDRVGGLGLGLVLSRFIVNAHGGSISACSTRGEGSCFTVKLPAATI